MLTSSELLDKIKEFGDAFRSDLVRSYGYESTSKDRVKHLNFATF